MIYYGNPSSPAIVQAMKVGQLGFIDTLAQRRTRPAGVDWCADNGAFSDKFNEAKWWAWLQSHAGAAGTCRFAVAPDVVGDAYATTVRSRPWLARIRQLGYPVAYVAQNGVEGLRGRTVAGGLTFPVPWDSYDCLFLGGSLECVPCRYVYRESRKPDRNEPCPRCRRRLTEWKLGAAARTVVAEAKARGKWVHMGRVSSFKRLQYAHAIGCDSADGTYLTFGADKNLPRLLGWLERVNNQQALCLAT